MAGKIKNLIDLLIEKRSNGDPLIAEMTKTKLVMKGINPDKYDSSSIDDPEVINKIEGLAKDLGLSI